jgi:hypothetical protein
MGAGVAQSVQCLTTDWTGLVQFVAEAKDFSCSLCPDQLWSPLSLLSSGYQGPFLGVKHGWGMTLTTHTHLVLRSRMSRSYKSLSFIPVSCSRRVTVIESSLIFLLHVTVMVLWSCLALLISTHLSHFHKSTRKSVDYRLQRGPNMAASKRIWPFILAGYAS